MITGLLNEEGFSPSSYLYWDLGQQASVHSANTGATDKVLYTCYITRKC